MSGGGDSNGKSGDKKTANEGYYPGGPKGPMKTVQPAFPGQNEAIAAQLAAAFGQTPQGLLAHMAQFYAPMQMADYNPPASTPGTTTPPAGGGSSQQQPVRSGWSPIPLDFSDFSL